jgi:hypothetical protein
VLNAKFETTAGLLTIVERCRDLEALDFTTIDGIVTLQKSDILAIGSLCHLKSIDIGSGDIEDEALSSLSTYSGIRNLGLSYLNDPLVLSEIGRKLVCLDLFMPSKEVVDGIVENCPIYCTISFDLYGLRGRGRRVGVDGW